MPRPALLRVCGKCSWIWEWEDENKKTVCPICKHWNFTHSYSAHSQYGRLAYKFKFTQEPWIDKKVNAFLNDLNKVVIEYNEDHYPGWDDPPY